jgi:DNA polymerase-3 subunit delta
VDVVFHRENLPALFRPLRRVYLFHGEDDYQKEEALHLLRKEALDESFAEFDSQTMEAQSSAPEEILAAAGLAPFASPVRLVVVEGAEAYRRRERADEADRLATGIAGLGASSCLVLVVGAEEDESGRKTILNAKLDAAIRAHGAVVSFRALTEEALREWVHRRARSAGKQIEPEAAERLALASHGDRTALRNELEKAICYSGERPSITMEDVQATGSYDPEDVMFKLVEAITLQNADRSLRLLRELLRYDTRPQSVAGKLIALLGRQFRLLWQAGELQRRRVPHMSLRNLPEEVLSELPAETNIRSMTWKGRELYQQAQRWDRRRLHEAFGLLLDCDLANKGGGEGSEDVVTNIELLIIRLCACR